MDDFLEALREAMRERQRQFTLDRALDPIADPTAPPVTTGGPHHAHIEGFDVHANAAVRAGETERLEHLCRYILQPPVAQTRRRP